MCTQQERLFLLYVTPHKYIYKAIEYIYVLHRITRHLGLMKNKEICLSENCHSV